MMARSAGRHQARRGRAASAVAYLATLVTAIGLGAAIGRAIARARAPRVPDLTCGGCEANLGTLSDMRSPYRRSAVLAHLSVCRGMSEATRQKAAALTATDLAPLDWARLRQELADHHRIDGPHADPGILHSRGACEACDHYPDRQATRARENATSPNPRRQE